MLSFCYVEDFFGIFVCYVLVFYVSFFLFVVLFEIYIVSKISIENNIEYSIFIRIIIYCCLNIFCVCVNVILFIK